MIGGPRLAETTRQTQLAGGDALCSAGALVARAAWPSVLARAARVEPDRPGAQGVAGATWSNNLTSLDLSCTGQISGTVNLLLKTKSELVSVFFKTKYVIGQSFK
jgi:hypothetical protein